MAQQLDFTSTIYIYTSFNFPFDTVADKYLQLLKKNITRTIMR